MYPLLKQEHYKNFGGLDQHRSIYTTEETKFLNLRNYTFERLGSLSTRPGQEVWATLSSASLSALPSSFFQYNKSSGASYLVFDGGAYLSAFAPNFTSFSGFTIGASLPIDFEVVNDTLYFANGQVFGRYDGQNAISYFLSDAVDPLALPARGLTFNTSLTTGPTSVIESGTFVAAFSYLRQGLTTITDAVRALTFLDVDKRGNQFPANNTVVENIGSTITSRGMWVIHGITIPPAQGISSALPGLLTPAGSTLIGVASSLYLQANHLGVTTWHLAFNHFTLTNTYDFSFNQLSATPKYLELYNNILFAAGFSGSDASNVFYSEIAQPDIMEQDNFFEVRSGNSDPISGLAVFQDALLIFKSGSMFELRGEDEESFQVRTISTEYGLVNNRAWCVFENRLWFVDRRGIMEYDGANLKVVSEEIEPYLEATDITKIQAFHVKKKQEVWFCTDLICFIYDYFMKAWKIYDRVAIDNTIGSAVIDYSSSRSDVSYFRQGTSFVQIARFGDSLATDFGSAITLVSQTRFHKRLEQTTQELWRRYYLNIDTPSSTLSVTLGLIPDYGTSIAQTVSFDISTFQRRVDFGLSARGLSVQMIIQSTQKVFVNGYALESRYLRNV